MECYSIEPITRKYIKGCGFLLFMRNLFSKYRKLFLDAATKTRPEALKTATRKTSS